MNYIIDATNICISLSPKGKTSLLPLFQIMLAIYRRGEECICFFDESTRFHNQFESWLFNQITTSSGFSNRVPMVADEVFWLVHSHNSKGETQVADDIILSAARKHSEAYILSFDQFRDDRYKKRYGWSERESSERILRIDPFKDSFQLILGNEKCFRELSIPGSDVEEIALELLNIIEEKNGRLTGKIRDVSLKKQLGKIIRQYTDMPVIHFRPGNHDPNFNFSQSRGQEVRFSLNFFRKKDDQGKVSYYINATGLVPLVTSRIENQILCDENRRLLLEGESLKRQLQTTTQNYKAALNKIQTNEEETSVFHLQIETLKEEVAWLKKRLTHAVMHSISDQGLEEKLKGLRKDYNRLLEDFNQQQVLLLWLKQAQAPKGDFSRVLEMLQHELERLQGENALLRNNNRSRPSSYLNPKESLKKDSISKWWDELNEDWQIAFAHCFGMHLDNPSLGIIRKILSATELTMLGHYPFIFNSLPIKLKDLSGLFHHKNLRTLNLSYNSITDLQFLSQLNDLNRLLLIGNRGLTSLRGLEYLPNLRYLDIKDVPVPEEEISWLLSHTLSPSLEVVR